MGWLDSFRNSHVKKFHIAIYDNMIKTLVAREGLRSFTLAPVAVKSINRLHLQGINLQEKANLEQAYEELIKRKMINREWIPFAHWFNAHRGTEFIYRCAKYNLSTYRNVVRYGNDVRLNRERGSVIPRLDADTYIWGTRFIEKAFQYGGKEEKYRMLLIYDIQKLHEIDGTHGYGWALRNSKGSFQSALMAVIILENIQQFD